MAETPAPPPRGSTVKHIPIVGIGASAGGLEALQTFFKHTPVDSGFAFVVIQHLSPDYKSLMDELLARQTDIPIDIASDGMSIQPDHIYLIPPRNNMTIFHGKLYLEPHNAHKGLNLPVDVFFRSLAMDQGKNALGVILSGTGSDGMLGTRAIKEAGGMVMVQDEESAKFDGMPRSAMSTGLVDYILPPEKMALALVDFSKHPFVSKADTLEKSLSSSMDTLGKIIMILRDFSGIDFSLYKENTIIRRLERRVSINRFENLEGYLAYLRESDKEKDILYRELLIGVTRFFREHEFFESLRTKILPSLQEKDTIRVWSAGCSTGEEVYSLAILMSEYLSSVGSKAELKIFATDVDNHAIEYAGRGFYPDSIVADLDPQLLTKYFSRVENGFQICEQIRRSIVFASHNILKDSPFSRLDLLVCRNLFIYLKPDVQSKLLAMFYHSISPSGYLFMGSSETVGDMATAFDCIDTKAKLYRANPSYRSNTLELLSTTKVPPLPELDLTSHGRPRRLEGIKFEEVMHSVAASVLPPSILIDKNNTILHIINDVSRFVRLQPGRFSANLMDNIVPEIGVFISTMLRKLRSQEARDNPIPEVVPSHAVFENLVGIGGFPHEAISLEARSIETDHHWFYLVTFRITSQESSEQPINHGVGDLDKHYLERTRELEKELQFTRENLQATVEELETANEELQSSNEELIASNEELQSTNEELQSVNEELYTVNSEYQAKIEELTRLNNDVNNLMKNTEVGAVYLDRNLNIRKITPMVSSITNILQTDIGRPIRHISILPEGTEGILQDIETVGKNLQTIDRELTIENGTTYLCRIRPYRTDFNAVDGILLTFVDITTLKKMTNKALITTQRLDEALRMGNMAWWEMDLTTREVICDPRKATMLGYQPETFPKTMEGICALVHPEDYPIMMKAMEDHLAGRNSAWESLYRIRRKDCSWAWYFDRGSISERDQTGKPTKVMGTVIDVSMLKNLELKVSDLDLDQGCSEGDVDRG